MIKVCHFDEDSATTCKFIKFMKFISMMKIYQTNCINLIIFGLVINLNNTDLTLFCFKQLFSYFPGWGWGWVAGVGQIKIKDHLSPAEAETWAELGKNKAYICRGNRQQHLYNFRENYIYELKGKTHTSNSKNLNLLGGRDLFCDLSRSCHTVT